jgi:hypothetical protein
VRHWELMRNESLAYSQQLVSSQFRDRGTLEKRQRMIQTLLARSILAVVHFLYLCYAYIASWLRKVHDIIHFRRQLAILHSSDCNAPSHVALVLDGVSDKLSVRISGAIEFLLGIPAISRLSLFLPVVDLPFTISSSKVRIFHAEDVPRSFHDLMKREGRLTEEAYRHPFTQPLDLVIIYSWSSSLCNFFPWTMDLAAFVLGGPITNMSPASIVEGLLEYVKTEQRFGK